MKKLAKRLIIVCLIVMATAMSISEGVQAGVRDIIIDNASFAEKIDKTIWNVPEDGVVSEDNKLVFLKESSTYTRIIAKQRMEKDASFENLFTADITMIPQTIPEGENFIFAFGLSSVEAISGEAGNVEILLGNNGSAMTVGVMEYGEDGNENVLLSAKNCGISLSRKICLSVTASMTGELSVKVNGNNIFDGKFSVSGEGRVGFLQTGGCAVSISDMNIVAQSYDRPENCNVNETFDNGTMNVNTLTSKLINTTNYYPSVCEVMEYNGNSVLMFKNCGLAYISTQYQYSNFELTFDLPYIQSDNEVAEDGAILEQRSNWFGVSFGDELIHYSDGGYVNSPEMLTFGTDSSVVASVAQLGYRDDSHLFFDKERASTFRVSVIDTNVTVEVKWKDEATFTTLLSYRIGNETPTGYIHIWSGNPSNFAIDNIQIINKDESPNLIDVEYKSGLIEAPEDYDYEPIQATMKEEGKKQGFNWYYLIPAAAFLGIAAIGVCVVIKNTRGKKVKGGENE